MVYLGGGGGGGGGWGVQVGGDGVDEVLEGRGKLLG